MPDFKYYTPGKRVNGKRTADALRVEALLVQWFETPVSLDELAAKNNTTPGIVRRVIRRAINRKPALAGIKQHYADTFLDKSNFTGGIALGQIKVKPSVIATMLELRAKGMTYRQIAKQLNLAVYSVWRYVSGANYDSRRAESAEDYGLPHA